MSTATEFLEMVRNARQRRQPTLIELQDRPLWDREPQPEPLDELYDAAKADAESHPNGERELTVCLHCNKAPALDLGHGKPLFCCEAHRKAWLASMAAWGRRLDKTRIEGEQDLL